MNLFNHVKVNLSILDVVGEYTKLKKAGTYWKATCPFHHEKTASFTVSPHKEIFYCFGCNKGGDLIAFIASAENCTQLEAAQHLVERYNLDVPANVANAITSNTDEKNRYFDLCKSVALWCHAMLKKSPIASNYLYERGFNDTTIDLFQIGYFPGGLRSIRSFVVSLRSKSILQSDLIEARIIAESRNILYSPFEKRIIFPIKDHLGRFCGFGGRIFEKQDQRAKYYNSHENDYFNKGSLLFGFDSAKKSIQKKESLFLVEGYTDCIAMVQYGFENTVATLGTSCTAEHLKVLSRYTSQIYTLYDGDNAGKKAITRLIELCWQVNIELKVICLPDGEDPASFLDKGGSIQKITAKAKDIFTFFIESLGRDFAKKTLRKKLQLLDKLLSIVQNIQEPLKRDIILQNASNALGVPFESLRSELNKRKRDQRIGIKTKTEPQENVERHNNSENLESILEKKILFAILHNMTLFNMDNADYLIACLPAPLNTMLTKLKMLKKRGMETPLNFSHLFEIFDDNEKMYVSKNILELDQKVDTRSFDQLLIRFQKKTWKVIVQDIKARLAQAESENNTEEIETILHNFSKLKKKLLNRDQAIKKQ